MNQARGLERVPNRRNPPIHHIGRRDDVRACVGVRARLAHESFDREVILDVTRPVNQAILAVRSERVESHVGDDA